MKKMEEKKQKQEEEETNFTYRPQINREQLSEEEFGISEKRESVTERMAHWMKVKEKRK